jgi:hypothetical protein
LESAAREAGIAVLITTPDAPDLRHSHRVMSLSFGRLVDPGRRRAAVVDLNSKRP